MTRISRHPFSPEPPARRSGGRHLARRLTPMIVTALTLTVLGCREDAESPSSPESGPALAATATTALAFYQLSGGWYFTCGVTTDSRAYCWGSNVWGALGDGTSGNDIQRSAPVAVRGGLSFRQISAGGQHSCGVTTDYRAYCWGGNLSGQLGDGTTTTRLKPVAVVGGHHFVQVAAGVYHTCGLTYPDRRAYCWGFNTYGQLGDGTAIDRAAPVPVLGGRQFRQVSSGQYHNCGITTTLQMFCWGDNQHGELGDSTTTRRSMPVPVAGGQEFRQVAAGWTFTCGVTTSDKAYCWGQGAYGQLGNGKTGRRLWPGPVTGGLSFRRVTTGWRHACGETPLNRAYCWGYNAMGQLGIGTYGPESCNTLLCSTRPLPVVGGLYFRQLSAGQVHTCGKTPDKVAYCWGDDGTGSGTKTSPTRVPDPLD